MNPWRMWCPPFPPISMLLGMGSMCCRHFYQFLEISSQVETVGFVNIEMGVRGRFFVLPAPTAHVDNSVSDLCTSSGLANFFPSTVPLRICITFHHATFWYRPKTSEFQVYVDRAENTTNTRPGSLNNFSENVTNHENGSELDPYSTSRAENQAF